MRLSGLDRLRIKDHDQFSGVILGRYDQPIDTISAAEVDSTYEAWTQCAQERWQAYVKETGGPQAALDSIRAWAARHPMTVSTTFDNEHGPDFSEIFEEAPVIEGTPRDTARLKDYAMKLRRWMINRDTSAIYDAFEVRMNDEFRMSGAPEENRSRFVETYQSGLIFEDADEELTFGRSKVGVRRWSGGRVWELYRKPSKPLLRRMDVYVAEIDGELKVVR